jgi:hypothetical protein
MLWFSEVHELLFALFFNSFSCDSNLSFVAGPDSCHNRLHHSEGKKRVVRCINIYIFSLKTVAVFAAKVAADAGRSCE